MTLSSHVTLTDRITIDPPLHRYERLREWMELENLDACVAFGPKHASHLAGYARYYGGPTGVVVARNGPRTLAVMHDEAPVARELGDADLVTSYGERGFGINLTPLPLLAKVVADLPEVRRRVGLADELGGTAELLHPEADAELVDAAYVMWRIRLVGEERR